MYRIFYSLKTELDKNELQYQCYYWCLRIQDTLVSNINTFQNSFLRAFTENFKQQSLTHDVAFLFCMRLGKLHKEWVGRQMFFELGKKKYSCFIWQLRNLPTHTICSLRWKELVISKARVSWYMSTCGMWFTGCVKIPLSPRR